MKVLTAVIVLGFAACLAGCQSMVNRFEASVTHMAGGITESDVAADLFRQHIGIATSRAIIIDYSLGHSREQGDSLDIPGGQAGALSMLQAVSAHDYFSTPGITTTMAVILCSDETKVKADSRARQVYKFDREGIPTYIVSRTSVAGGAIQQNGLSSNILAFASAQASNPAFPFELPEGYAYKLDQLDPINEYRAYKKGPRGLGDAWMTAKEANEYQRTMVPRMFAVSWPTMLPDASTVSDVLCISWKERRVSWTHSGPGNEGSPRTACKVSMISMKDNLVYYHKTHIHRVSVNNGFESHDYRPVGRRPVYPRDDRDYMGPAERIEAELNHIKSLSVEHAK